MVETCVHDDHNESSDSLISTSPEDPAERLIFVYFEIESRLCSLYNIYATLLHIRSFSELPSK